MGGGDSLGEGQTLLEKGLGALRAYKVGCCPRQCVAGALSKDEQDEHLPPLLDSVLLGTEPHKEPLSCSRGEIQVPPGEAWE